MLKEKRKSLSLGLSSNANDIDCYLSDPFPSARIERKHQKGPFLLHGHPGVWKIEHYREKIAKT